MHRHIARDRNTHKVAVAADTDLAKTVSNVGRDVCLSFSS